MPKLKIEYPSQKPADQVYSQVKLVLIDNPDLKRLDSQFVCEFDDATKSGKAHSSRLTGQISVQNSVPDGCIVKIEIELPFILLPVKGVVEKVLRKQLEKVVG